MKYISVWIRWNVATKFSLGAGLRPAPASAMSQKVGAGVAVLVGTAG